MNMTPSYIEGKYMEQLFCVKWYWSSMWELEIKVICNLCFRQRDVLLSYSSEAEMSGELAVGVVFLHRCLVWHILEWDWDGRKGDGVGLRVAPWTLHTLRGPRWCSLHGRAAVRFTAGSCMVISVEFELTGGRRLLKKSCLWDLMRNRRGKVMQKR